MDVQQLFKVSKTSQINECSGSEQWSLRVHELVTWTLPELRMLHTTYWDAAFLLPLIGMSGVWQAIFCTVNDFHFTFASPPEKPFVSKKEDSKFLSDNLAKWRTYQMIWQLDEQLFLTSYSLAQTC